MPNDKGCEERGGGSSFSLELVAMVAVIAISSWHIGSYMSTFDGWIMAAIMGATLGFCNFLCAHNIFKAGSTSRFPSFVGLIFFAITSTWMQYTYFNENPDIGRTLLHGVNLDALALGIWAPAAEILLGWIYAANAKSTVLDNRSTPTRTPLRDLAQALAQPFDSDAALGPFATRLRSPEPPVNIPAVHSSRPPYKPDSHSNGAPIQINKTATAPGTHPEHGTTEMSKPDAMARVLNIFATNPHATYEEVGAAIGRSKSTVSNYVRELKEAGRVQVSDEGGVQVSED